MRVNEVRDRVVDDHIRLGGRLGVIERLTARVLAGDAECVDALGFECEMMLADLAQHMSWEDRNLAPVLYERDAQRLKRLEEDHREQRELLRYILGRVREPTCPAVLVARTMLDFASLLREDIRREEAEILLPSAPYAGFTSIGVATH